MKGFLSFFHPRYPVVLVYMLQNTEYQVGSYLRWYWRTGNFNRVMKRRSLHRTKPARLLLLALRAGMVLQLGLALFFAWMWFDRGTAGVWLFALALLVSYPVVWAHLIVVPLVAARIFIAAPRNRRLVAQSRRIFAKHKGVKIAVAGSYGKTTMKELLSTVLAEAKTVASTPGNKNVSVSHAAFAARLTGKEDVLIIEYGEGHPGDVARFADITRPDIGVITGIAPAHLDQYASLEAAAQDIFNLADYLGDQQVYVNADSVAAQSFIKDTHIPYDAKGVGEWKTNGVQVGFDGVRFTMKNGTHTLQLHSELLGRHQIGPLAAVAALAGHLGLSGEQIQAGIAKTVPFEHRMQPRQLGGAWIIDDTYNGNIDGVRAGLALLAELPARRKIYVTPGLVDQGVETTRVHLEMGELIAAAKPDLVVLMQNSVQPHIMAGLKKAGFAGDLRIEEDPLGFYTGLEQFVAAGDLWLLQNDWPDNYQ